MKMTTKNNLPLILSSVFIFFTVLFTGYLLFNYWQHRTELKKTVGFPDALVSITESNFAPSNLRIEKGQTVRWTNKDTGSHQIINISGLKGFESRILEPGATFSFTFRKEGIFTYLDKLNPARLQGTIQVD